VFGRHWFEDGSSGKLDTHVYVLYVHSWVYTDISTERRQMPHNLK